jgi:hypothetical protein
MTTIDDDGPTSWPAATKRLVEQFWESFDEHLHAPEHRQHLLERYGTYYPLDQRYDAEHSYLWLLEELDKTGDTSLLMPLLDLPNDYVRHHFEDLLCRRRMLKYRKNQGRTLPSYNPMPPKEEAKTVLVDMVRFLIAGGVSENEALDAAAWYARGKNIATKQTPEARDVLAEALYGRDSVLRGLKKRRKAEPKKKAPPKRG